MYAIVIFLMHIQIQKHDKYTLIMDLDIIYTLKLKLIIFKSKYTF